MRQQKRNGKVRYAVVGLGHIAQNAVLPAFARAENSELAALVSNDPTKRRELGRMYGVQDAYPYEEYESCLKSGRIDAVYIALPNHMHREYAVRAAEAGVHVLCEKPMAVTEKDCEAMIAAARENGVKLMVAYRLHFEEANLQAVELANSGKLGAVRLFQSLFTMQVKAGDIRLQKRALGGGPLYDIGIYCINAARCLFRAEPTRVMAWSANNGEDRFRDCEEMAACALFFPAERLATFTCSFGTADVSQYQVVGTKGDLRVEPAYEYVEELRHVLTVGSQRQERKFPRRSQFAPELVYFSGCVQSGQDPEPSGEEGLADVRIVRALYQSIQSGGKPVDLHPFRKERRPTIKQEIQRPPVKPPELVHAQSPHGER